MSILISPLKNNAELFLYERQISNLQDVSQSCFYPMRWQTEKKYSHKLKRCIFRSHIKHPDEF